MSSPSELPEGLGELNALQHDDLGMVLIGPIEEGVGKLQRKYVYLPDLLAWARPLQAKLEAAEALLVAADVAVGVLWEGPAFASAQELYQARFRLEVTAKAARAAGLGQGGSDGE